MREAKRTEMDARDLSRRLGEMDTGDSISIVNAMREVCDILSRLSWEINLLQTDVEDLLNPNR